MSSLHQRCNLTLIDSCMAPNRSLQTSVILLWFHARPPICQVIGCQPVRGDNSQALASGLSYIHVNNPY